MKRREFISLIGGAAAAWPLAARAQQGERVRRIAVFPLGPEGDQDTQAYIRMLRQSLDKLGWSDGRNIRIDVRWEAGDSARIPADVEAALGLDPEVIVSGGTPTTTVLAQRTRTIPIIFVNVGDPVASGLVRSLAQPGGNITGFTAVESAIGGKWVELLKEIAPRVERLLLLFDPRNPTSKFHVPTIEAAASSILALPVTTAPVHSVAEVESAIGAFSSKPNGGLIALPSPFVRANSAVVIALAAKYELPAIYGVRTFVSGGGLMSYGSDWGEQYRQAASYVDRILKGARPSELAVQLPTKFELAINLKTAKTLGLDVPLHLQQLADEIIE
ncbi:MAG TPA: ABC transporter substrate-binding protein [Bradyrhizobium sp.]|nr:ABC transporter substrate-binding protein [Bradyrhizobium sp.]